MMTEMKLMVNDWLINQGFLDGTRDEQHQAGAVINRQVQVDSSEAANLMVSLARGPGMKTLYKSS